MNKQLVKCRRIRRRTLAVHKIESFVLNCKNRRRTLESTKQSISKWKAAATIIQSFARMTSARSAYTHNLRRNSAATTIAKSWRRTLQQVHYLVLQISTVKIQSILRMKLAISHFNTKSRGERTNERKWLQAAANINY